MAYMRFERSYFGIGTWDIKLPMTSKYLTRIRTANMISIGPKRAGIILDRQFEDNDDFYGLTISGSELKGITAKRIVMPPAGSAYQSYSQATPEYVIDQLLTAQLLTTANVNRKVFGTIKSYTPGAEQIIYDGRFGNLAEDISSISEAYQVGWYADIESRAIVWSIYRGIDRRVSSLGGSTILLSASRDNLGQRSYSETYSIPNTAIVGGQGEGADRHIIIVNDAAVGIDRNEMFIDARDVESDADLPQRGEEKLAEESAAEVYSFGMENSAVKAYITGTFDLGDQCTVRDIDFLAGNDLEGRLSSTEEVYEDDMLTVQATIGYDKLRLAAVVAKIRRSQLPFLTA
jgi:hypothetical protein